MSELLDHPYLQSAFLMKTRLLLLVGLVLCALSVVGQSTAEPLQVELTLCAGRYPEAFASDTLHRIGQFGYSTVSGRAYRFGVQGQDKDDEIHGATGSSISFEYRMHDPRVGRFLSMDPLASHYPFYSPYSFSGNRVIDAVELEGLEPGVLFGSHEQFQITGLEKNVNYKVFELRDMTTAYFNLKNHVEAGNDVKVIYMTLHGIRGYTVVNEGIDGQFFTQGNTPNGPQIYNDDVPIDAPRVRNYMNASCEEQAAMVKSDSKYMGLQKLKELTDLMGPDGVLILGGCHTAEGEEGNDLVATLSAFLGVKVMASQDYVTDSSRYCQFFGVGRSGTHLKAGWSVAEPCDDRATETGCDVQLNGVGPLYESTPCNDQ
jgi:RHS repeat-associated protein